MSWKHYLSNYPKAKRNQQDRSRKDCICGGHSAKDVKKNLYHPSTLKRHWIRIERRFKEALNEY